MSLVLAAAVGLSAPAIDDTPPPAEFTLRWQAPEACPSQQTIEGWIAELTHDRIEGDGAMVVTGVITEESDGYALALTTVVGDREGRRDLRAPQCEALAQSVALVVAVTMVPALARDPSPSPQPKPDPAPLVPDPTDAAEPRPTAPPQARAPSERDASSQPRLTTVPWLRAGFGVDIGGNPSSSLAARLAVGLAWPHVRAGVEGSYIAPQRARGSGRTAGLVQQGLVAATACGVPTRASWSFPLCAALEVGLLRADSRGVAPEATKTGLLVTPLVRAGAMRRWHRFGVWLDAEGLIRGATTRVVVADDEVFRPNAVWFRALMGIEVVWGENRR